MDFFTFKSFSYLKRINLAGCKLEADLNVRQQVLLQLHLEDQRLPAILHQLEAIMNCVLSQYY